MEYYFKRVNEPKINNIYWQYDIERNIMFPCKIKEGQCKVQGRMSNFWHYKNLQNGKKEKGYGCFFEKIPYDGKYNEKLP